MATLGNVMRRMRRDLRAKNGLRLEDVDIIDAVNDAVQHYRARRFAFNEANAANGLAPTVTTVAGTTSYALPSTVIEPDEILYLYAGYNYPLDEWSWTEQKAALAEDVVIQGFVLNYVIHGGYLHLYPAPDLVTTVTITGLVEITPTPFVNKTSTNAWLTDALALIKARACWDLSLNALANPDRAADFKAAESEALFSLNSETRNRLATGRAVVEHWDCV